MLGRVRLAALVALIAAAPARAHSGEALICLPFVWALEAYIFCLDGCLDGIDACCGCGAPDHVRADDDDEGEDEDEDEAGEDKGDGGIDVVFRPAAMRY